MRDLDAHYPHPPEASASVDLPLKGSYALDVLPYNPYI